MIGILAAVKHVCCEVCCLKYVNKPKAHLITGQLIQTQHQTPTEQINASNQHNMDVNQTNIESTQQQTLIKGNLKKCGINVC